MRKQALWVTAACCGAMALSLAACVPSTENSVDNASAQTESAVPTTNALGENHGLDDVGAAMEANAEKYKPIVRTLADGTRVQLTPDVQNAYWHMGSEPTQYNTQYLNADERGCVSCHADGLDDLLQNKMEYKHVQLTNNMGADVQVGDCRMCHEVGTGYVTKNFQLGTLIHGIHSKDTFKGDCMSCHNATADGAGMQLWEDVKYDVMQGFTFLANDEVENADFMWEQDTTNEMYTEDWVSGDTNVENTDKAMRGEELDPDVFDNWTISMTGLVDNSFSMTLLELIEQAPSETFVTSSQCVMNAPGGEMVSNVEVTGIPVSWLLEKAGVQEGATGLMAVAPDGWKRGETIEKSDQAYLVYEINGKRLDWDDGYPVRIWYKGRPVPSSIRWTSELQVVDTPANKIKTFEGWVLDDTNTLDASEIGMKYNVPNAGITYLHEGEIIEAGKQHEFTGWADAFGQHIKAIELSLDNGETWMTYDVSSSDSTKWVYWHFNYTPEVGSYVLSVRAVLDDGTVSVTPDKVMFNAQ